MAYVSVELVVLSSVPFSVTVRGMVVVVVDALSAGELARATFRLAVFELDQSFTSFETEESPVPGKYCMAMVSGKAVPSASVMSTVGSIDAVTVMFFVTAYADVNVRMAAESSE